MCFFFQAEDGIRDTSVTGVQTCALPISRSHAESRRYLARPDQHGIGATSCNRSGPVRPGYIFAVVVLGIGPHRSQVERGNPGGLRACGLKEQKQKDGAEEAERPTA